MGSCIHTLIYISFLVNWKCVLLWFRNILHTCIITYIHFSLTHMKFDCCDMGTHYIILALMHTYFHAYLIPWFLSWSFDSTVLLFLHAYAVYFFLCGFLTFFSKNKLKWVMIIFDPTKQRHQPLGPDPIWLVFLLSLIDSLDA